MDRTVSSQKVGGSSRIKTPHRYVYLLELNFRKYESSWQSKDFITIQSIKNGETISFFISMNVYVICRSAGFSFGQYFHSIVAEFFYWSLKWWQIKEKYKIVVDQLGLCMRSTSVCVGKVFFFKCWVSSDTINGQRSETCGSEWGEMSGCVVDVVSELEAAGRRTGGCAPLHHCHSASSH